MSELLSIPDLQDLLGGVARRTVIGWRDRGILPPALKVGRLVRWRRGDIEAWIQGGCIPFYKTQGSRRGARHE